MPVAKFRSVDDMPEAPFRDPSDPALWRAIREVWAFALRTCPSPAPPGVYKYRSLAEAKAKREAWEHERVRARLASQTRE